MGHGVIHEPKKKISLKGIFAHMKEPQQSLFPFEMKTEGLGLFKVSCCKRYLSHR